MNLGRYLHWDSGWVFIGIGVAFCVAIVLSNRGK